MAPVRRLSRHAPERSAGEGQAEPGQQPNIYYADSRVIELLIVAGTWYLAVVSVLTPLQMLLECRFSRGRPESPRERPIDAGR